MIQHHPNQLDIFGLLEPPPPMAPEPVPAARRFQIQAYGGPYEVQCFGDVPEPFEITVRDVRATITYSGGFCTYVFDGPGSPFWSETGFRSFGLAIFDPQAVAEAIERYVDAPEKKGGCGGKLTRWWPRYVLQWQQARSWTMGLDRAHVWDQWGPEKHAECWARHDATQAEALARMIAEGIDPNEVGPPDYHKGRWPKIAEAA